MPNWFSAFSMPMACAASATSSRNGNMTRVSVTANSNLPGTRANPDASSHTSCGLNIMPSTQIAPTTSSSAVATRLESSAASRFALGRQILREDRNEGGGKRALGEQIAREIGDAEAQQKRVVSLAGAEQARHDHLAHQPADAAQKNRGRDHARRSASRFRFWRRPPRGRRRGMKCRPPDSYSMRRTSTCW